MAESVSKSRAASQLCYNEGGRQPRDRGRGQDTVPRNERTARGNQDDQTLRDTARVYWRGRSHCYYVLYSIPKKSPSGRIVGWAELRLSTGVKDRSAYDEAKAWASKNKPTENAVAQTKVNAAMVTLEEYAHNFFTVSHQAQLNAFAEHGKIPETLDSKADMLRLHILPHLGQYLLPELTRAVVKDWVSLLHTQPQKPRNRSLSRNYCKQILATLREILERATEEYEETIPSNPAAGRIKLYDDKRDRGILSREEINALLDERTIRTIWRGNIISYTAAVLAITLGMRLGEILGLQVEHVHLGEPSGPTIDIRHQWSRRLKSLKLPKKDSLGDDIAICNLAARRLRILIEEQAVEGEEDLLFCRTDDKRRPLSYWRFERHFGYAMDKLGIDHERRNIVLHSGRHGLATMGKEEVGEAETRAVTRHKSDSAFKIYSSHKTREGTRKVANMFDAILAENGNADKERVS